MFKILILILLTACTPLYATTQYELSADQLKRVPLLLHQDAREFYRTVAPLIDHEETHYYGQQLKNPYELFFEALIFGRLFDVPLPQTPDSCILVSLSWLLNADDSQRHYLSRISQSTQVSSTQNLTYTDIERYQNGFNLVFDTELNNLKKNKNLFAFFIKGLMEYESGVIHDNQSRKQLGEKYISITADGYVLPALSFLEFVYSVDSKRQGIVKEKIRQSKTLNLNLSLLDALKHQIQYGINTHLSDKLLPSKNKISDDCYVDYAQKLRDSAHTVAEFDRNFYENVLKHLKKTTGSMRRSAAFTTSNRLWQAVTIGGAAALAACSGISVWYGSTYTSNDSESHHETEFMISTMVRSSLIAGLTSVLSCSYNCYLVYNSPRFLTLNDIVLNTEIELSALYWSTAHATQDVHEVLAESIIDVWFKQKGFSILTHGTLSQLALTR